MRGGRAHLVGADGDVGAVEEGVALDELVGGEGVRGDGLAAGDGDLVRAGVEAAAQAEEVVRRRHAAVVRAGGRADDRIARPGDDRIARRARAGGLDLVRAVGVTNVHALRRYAKGLGWLLRTCRDLWRLGWLFVFLISPGFTRTGGSGQS